MVDISPQRLDTAKRLGCSAAVANADELAAPLGWDVIIDRTAAEPAIRDGLTRVGRGGTFLQLERPKRTGDVLDQNDSVMGVDDAQ